MIDDISEISDLMERVHWDGIKLPAVFIGDKPVLSGYIDTGAVREVLVRMGIK
ncbi:MAG: hypothetical protein K6T91_00010 [Firmicutes bacterium]|nr:hypothetical protein [Bacillota bacterium]